MSFDQFTIEQSTVFPEVVSFTPSAFTDFRGSVYTSYLKGVVARLYEKIGQVL